MHLTQETILRYRCLGSRKRWTEIRVVERDVNEDGDLVCVVENGGKLIVTKKKTVFYSNKRPRARFKRSHVGRDAEFIIPSTSSPAFTQLESTPCVITEP